MKIEVTVSAIKAIAPNMGNKDVRDYLNGLLVEVTTNAVCLAGCDGHTLGVAKMDGVQNEADCGTAIIARKLIEEACKLKCETVEISIEGQDVRVAHAGGTLSGHTVDGRFPDWRAVLSEPGDDTYCAPTNVNAEYMERIAKASKAFKRRYSSITMQTRGDRSLVWCLRDLPDGVGVSGVIMPQREKADAKPFVPVA